MAKISAGDKKATHLDRTEEETEKEVPIKEGGAGTISIPKEVVLDLQNTATDLDDEAENEEDRGVARLCKSDANTLRKVADLLRANKLVQAHDTFFDLDTAPRDRVTPKTYQFITNLDIDEKNVKEGVEEPRSPQEKRFRALHDTNITGDESTEKQDNGDKDMDKPTRPLGKTAKGVKIDADGGKDAEDLAKNASAGLAQAKQPKASVAKSDQLSKLPDTTKGGAQSAKAPKTGGSPGSTSKALANTAPDGTQKAKAPAANQTPSDKQPIPLSEKEKMKNVSETVLKIMMGEAATAPDEDDGPGPEEETANDLATEITGDALIFLTKSHKGFAAGNVAFKVLDRDIETYANMCRAANGLIDGDILQALNLIAEEDLTKYFNPSAKKLANELNALLN